MYYKFSTHKCVPTEEGRQQFFDHETFGKNPDEPDPYFLCLEQGKKWFSVEQESIRQSYLTKDWWFGFYSYWMDWKGERWMLKYLFSWCPKEHIPEWFYDENYQY